MSRFFYSFFFYLAMPFVLLRLLWRSRKEPEYRKSVAERFGDFRSDHAGHVIWIHAVSAGESIAAAPLIERLLAQGYHCLVTNMTPTGRDRVRSLLGRKVENCYAPYDLPGSVARFLDTNRPLMHIVIDTELWPNTLAACNARQVPALLVNGRMSIRSARGYKKISGLSRPMLQSLTALSVQTDQHKQRFVELGVSENRVHVTGSIKFDAAESRDAAESISRARQLVGNRPTLLGASTHDGEESALIEAYLGAREVLSDVLLVLVPRHTHRVSQVLGYCESAGLTTTLFSDAGQQEVTSDVLLVDIMGELGAFYFTARTALVGGSLVPVGGHNLLEGVRAGCAVVMGPHLDNIDDIAAQFEEAGGMVVVKDAQALIKQLAMLLTDEQARARMSDAAMKVLEKNRGALDRIQQLVLQQLVE
ncbi:MAG: lipid IV(A) 3-deoxy-D-manno-octulosonic acid transferase [Pseudomonadales bacterium]|nr:lipid IV(A) 3-deoxy-D-manno-octulosonic acid transferase [Pseudomonadales bacterium]MBO6597371.1 lipid IV(A) 3-deoxy-D-manno-octulosonic acid transferase [Pseudomonadales bacterium]MBO6657297.1 lipid IV(A) 3-deoxy-D-manno-octulosonic acid transferase [Pseudomonadales bacterium]MBO6703135.1 lipid IV(A) 3-deoxy-D-manno-octulosonic acid transferase [Pseudomonadales bacterium]MBO6824105.1 lipid IV(A) 3-deoxy-D-manno-octulosonic acid transferase [Pseudomonadales bacterium]